MPSSFIRWTASHALVMDFAKMVTSVLPDARGVSFVAVTQQFGYRMTTSDGSPIAGISPALSFAQFEREITGERIRGTKIAASKRKGIWMGGLVPLGYEVRERQLVINEAEATTVRHLFTRYCELGSVRLLKEELDRLGVGRSAPPKMESSRVVRRSHAGRFIRC